MWEPTPVPAIGADVRCAICRTAPTGPDVDLEPL